MSLTSFLAAAAITSTIITAVAIPVAAGPLAQALTPRSAPIAGCQSSEWPDFHYGFAALRLDLDASIMGDPVDCEHAIDAAGDTEQHTTTGLATYDHAANRPAFHAGPDNSAPRQSTIGAVPTPTPDPSITGKSVVLSPKQVSPVADELGVQKNEPVTVEEVAKAIKASGTSVAAVTRAINIATNS